MVLVAERRNKTDEKPAEFIDKPLKNGFKLAQREP